MRTFYPACLALTCLMLCAFPAQAEVVVIVSTKNSTKSLSIEQVADIFLGKNASFPKGTRATPLDQNETSAARDKFYLQVSGKTSSQMKAHWAKMLFTGRGQPPVESGDSSEIKRLVANNPELVGYIDKKDIDDSVKPMLFLP
ncbi:phosphate ABC transporter substrate-binding protein [Undibacterium sp. RuRC25W]|uniref:phosphate ABC transporter substrate-binding protein n=1 Tax=Undibacterium sp. RuRC25W TaxID=3413047 RepID=UPI003BF38653